MVFKNVTDLMKRHYSAFCYFADFTDFCAALASFLFLEFFKIICMKLCDNHDSKSLEATIE